MLRYFLNVAGQPGADDFPETEHTPLLATGYRLTCWPDVHGKMRTAKLLGAMSVMTQRDVTATWFGRRVGWKPEQAQRFLDGLAAAGDARRFFVTARSASPSRTPP